MSLDEVWLDVVYDEVTKDDLCIEDAVVSLLREIVRLRKQLAAAEEAARIVYAARRDGCALVPVSHALLSAEWSHEPMHLKLVKNEDGTHSMKIKTAHTQ